MKSRLQQWVFKNTRRLAVHQKWLLRSRLQHWVFKNTLRLAAHWKWLLRFTLQHWVFKNTLRLAVCGNWHYIYYYSQATLYACSTPAFRFLLRGLGVRVMVFIATFNNISDIYRGSQFYWWTKPEYPEKTNLAQVTDKLYPIQ